MGFRLIHISDTHLSRLRPLFAANFAAVVDHANREKPDFVLNTGDLTMNGADMADDLEFAADCHQRIDAPLWAVPGNHDLGDTSIGPAETPKHPISNERRRRYRRLFGAEWWLRDVEAWRFVACNAQLMGSGLAAEARQWTFLEESLGAADGRPTALITHKPLFQNTPADGAAAPQRFLRADAMARLIALIGDAGVKLVMTGHTHQMRQSRHAGVDFVWAPSTAFVLPDWFQPVMGEKRLGLADYRFDGDRVEVGFVVPDGMTETSLPQVPAAYGNTNERAAGLAE